MKTFKKTISSIKGGTTRRRKAIQNACIEAIDLCRQGTFDAPGMLARAVSGVEQKAVVAFLRYHAPIRFDKELNSKKVKKGEFREVSEFWDSFKPVRVKRERTLEKKISLQIKALRSLLDEAEDDNVSSMLQKAIKDLELAEFHANSESLVEEKVKAA